MGRMFSGTSLRGYIGESLCGPIPRGRSSNHTHTLSSRFLTKPVGVFGSTVLSAGCASLIPAFPLCLAPGTERSSPNPCLLHWRSPCLLPERWDDSTTHPPRVTDGSSWRTRGLPESRNTEGQQKSCPPDQILLPTFLFCESTGPTSREMEAS